MSNQINSCPAAARYMRGQGCTHEQQRVTCEARGTSVVEIGTQLTAFPGSPRAVLPVLELFDDAGVGIARGRLIGCSVRPVPTASQMSLGYYKMLMLLENARKRQQTTGDVKSCCRPSTRNDVAKSSSSGVDGPGRGWLGSTDGFKSLLGTSDA